jgi:triosephosphate isomerase
MKNVKLIAQNFDIYDNDNLHPFARTGDISLDHIYLAGAQGSILGHTEAGDSTETVNKKIKTIINNENIKKITDNFILHIVVGETWEEFKDKSHEEVGDILYQKCKEIFKDIPIEVLKNLIIAYDPKWGTFGSGQKNISPPSPKLISTCISKIRDFIQDNYKNINPFYVYGGRSTPERTLEILKDNNIDGLLLGSACNTIEKTMDIINTIKKIKGINKKVVVCNFKAFIPGDPYENYIKEFKKLSENFFVYIAPSYTDLRLIKDLI